MGVMKKKVQQLTAELSTLKSSKDVRGRVSEEWLLRVILAAPNVSGRALAESFHSLVGSDSNTISREGVGRIRSGFLEMWRNMLLASARDFITAQRAPATGGSREPATGGSNQFVSVFLTHVQDEADLRLLSSDPSSRPGLPRRSSTSPTPQEIQLARQKIERARSRWWQWAKFVDAMMWNRHRNSFVSFARLSDGFARRVHWNWATVVCGKLAENRKAYEHVDVYQ